MRLLTEAQQDLLVSALDSHRERLEEVMFRDTSAGQRSDRWSAEWEQTNELYELIIGAGVITLFDQRCER
ncbi:hypothetical protein [Schaalia hyovaginalis]|uniref:hypothetical protein n=1 Tax=Schaalia hyovaginalis TaxID=29316 RepID=UPI0026ECBFAC|nr:hypothetical protein [Schaalia hyovaginalis]MCI7513483.1 hypothetical protein [Schaalia hyovaginalis]MDY3666355.1 hypothetical protein [Schaalia hyovaginalis]MDY4491555.1 hypothetical protein [Schaalia hyovaginalis]MDY5601803.1 hypothetical protein [Schaalia hyovaginalis]